MTDKFEVNSWVMGLIALLVAASLALNVHFLRSIADRNTAEIADNREAIAEGIKWMQSHTQEAEKRLTKIETTLGTIKE